MIEIKGITLDFENKRVFDNFSAELPDVGIVVIRGESGAGKTSLLRLMAGLIRPQKGGIFGLENRKTAMVFQEPRLLLNRSALHNVALVSDRERARELLTELNLGDFLSVRAEKLSGGEKQRVALARALAFSRDVLLLDEPFSGLDVENKGRAARLIKTAELAVMVTHDEDDIRLFEPAATIRLGTG
ncbi:MAG: ATP-binding cassette domain-containing protein [Clostridia bacterium]|nr:ATP-binding cassette domain-containing protein [Clostridia bacterium]